MAKNVIRQHAKFHWAEQPAVACLFRTEPKTDDFFNVNIRCVLLVNRFAVGLRLQQ